MSIKTICIVLGELLAVWPLAAQIPIGVFRQHLPYVGFRSVAATNDMIYVASEQSIMYVDKSDMTTHAWSKVEGLSDIGIASIASNKASNTLIIAYNNGNIDIIRDDKLLNLPDIKNKQLTTSKRIYSLFATSAKAYLSTAFGVIVINLDNATVEDTWYTNSRGGYLNVYGIEIADNLIYMITERGIYTHAENVADMADFASWQLLAGTETMNVNRMTLFDNRLFFSTQYIHSPDSLYVYENGAPRYLDSNMQLAQIKGLKANDKLLAIAADTSIFFYNSNLELELHANWKTGLWINEVNNLLFEGDTVWIADGHYYYGLVFFHYPDDHSRHYLAGGPFTYMVSAIDIVNGKVAVVPGSRDGINSSWIHPSLSFFENGEWHFVESSFYDFGMAWDINNVAINPRNGNEMWCTSWGCGLFKIVNDQVTARYDSTNSPLVGNPRPLVSGISFDRNNNLWITTSNTFYPLHVLKSDGTWKSFSLIPAANVPDEDRKPEHVLVDSRGYKWITFSRPSQGSPLVVAFDDRGTIDNTSDDRMARVVVNYNSSDAEPANSVITCIAEGKDGAIWLGTLTGIKVIYYPENVFTQNGVYYAQYIKFLQNGYVELLLGNEKITAIAVDGANRKWIGTATAGLFLVSENGTESLLHFTEENSPLFSNNITSLAIDHSNGEVFIGTINGLLSYRGDATWGNESYDECKVFPNPVREGYTGPVAVSGLMDNSFCKITDAEGKLVWQGYAHGGELIWNCQDFYGKRPATGVYYVMSSNPAGKEKRVAKFLFIH
ncbi:MAG: hypothetical protein LBK03_03070 [Bacteroidales bacterium]|jgi:hypothetical protein|nr:hypothetical protein [Bacteroidales bacterium]